MFEVKKEAEQELVAQDGFARDDKRQRKLDVEIELESIDGCVMNLYQSPGAGWV